MIDDPSIAWLARVDRTGRPIYLAIFRALETAVRRGQLHPGDQLPSQRAVAQILGVDFTTVTRAYGAARDAGLIEGAVGRGTFVSARAASDDPGLVDLSMNLPPPPEGVSLGALLRETTQAILGRSDAATLMAYHPGAGALGQRTAGAAWLAPCLGEVDPARILVTAGAQTALAALLSTLAKRGDRIVVEALTYPGLKAAAAQLGIRLLACPTDHEGVLPDALERLCHEHEPVAIYLIPTMQNPTAQTMGLARRRAVAKIALAHDVWVIEDDPYSRLMDAPLPALATFAPTRTFHLATLSKCLTPGLRIAYLVCPDGAAAQHVADSLRAFSLMPPPLTAAVATAWIRDGVAEALLAGVRREARARRQDAARILPQARGGPDSIHVWLDLPDAWSPERLRVAAEERGLSLVTADAFAAGPDHPNGVRISLGAAAKRAVLADALSSIARLVREAPSPGRLVV